MLGTLQLAKAACQMSRGICQRLCKSGGLRLSEVQPRVHYHLEERGFVAWVPDGSFDKAPVRPREMASSLSSYWFASNTSCLAGHWSLSLKTILGRVGFCHFQTGSWHLSSPGWDQSELRTHASKAPCFSPHRCRHEGLFFSLWRWLGCLDLQKPTWQASRTSSS